MKHLKVATKSLSALLSIENQLEIEGMLNQCYT